MRFQRMITAIDVHAAGEPGRVITGGVLNVPGDSMMAKQQWLARHADGLRRLMLREPRGYPALCCNLLLPPCDPKAHAGFVIMEQTEYPAMSGSNTICVVTALLESLCALLVVRGGESASKSVEAFHSARWEANIYDES